MIFKGVLEGKPYPDHGLSPRHWAKIPPRQFRLDELITVTTVLALDKLLSEDSTFYGDLFAHVVRWRGQQYLEDGLHRAVRSALRNRPIVHARMLDLDVFDLRPGAPTIDEQFAAGPPLAPDGPPGGAHRRPVRTVGWTPPPPQRW
ncbi:MAG: type II toxin-antitoxin system VapB family antitoxin [Gordonia sp. (in: high G+C Gram-positive bacteria)]